MRCLSIIAVSAVLVLSARAQSIEQIPVTQAGLVPAPAFNSLTPDHKPPPVVPAAGPATPGLAAGNTSPFDQRLISPGSSSQLMSGYIVRERQMPELRPFDLYTKKGLEDLSFREHPGLNFGNFRNKNAKQADVLIEADRRLQEIQDFRDTAHAIDVGGDPTEANDILRATDEAYARNDFNLNPTNDIMDAPPPRAGTVLENFEQIRLTWLEDHF